MTIRRKLSTGISVLMVLFLLLGAISYFQIGQIDDNLEEIMQGKALGNKAVHLHRRYRTLDAALAQKKDSHNALFARVSKSLDEIGSILADTIRAGSDLQQPDDYRKALEATMMEVDIAELTGSLGTFLIKTSYQNRITQKLLIEFLNTPELFLTKEDLPRLKELLLSKDAIDIELRKSLAYYAMPGAEQMSQIAAIDPLNMRQFMIEKMALLHGGLVFDSGPYLLSLDRQSLLMTATPAEALRNRFHGVKLLEKINDVRMNYPDLRIGITGGYAVAAQEESLIRSDLLGCLIGSVLGISLLFFLENNSSRYNDVRDFAVKL